MDQMIRLDEIAKPSSGKSRRFRPFTSMISAAAMVGLYIGVFSIIVGKF